MADPVEIVETAIENSRGNMKITIKDLEKSKKPFEKNLRQLNRAISRETRRNENLFLAIKAVKAEKASVEAYFQARIRELDLKIEAHEEDILENNTEINQHKGNIPENEAEIAAINAKIEALKGA